MDEDGWMVDGAVGDTFTVHVTWDSDEGLASDPPSFAETIRSTREGDLPLIDATPTGPRLYPDLGDAAYAWLLVVRLLDPGWVSNWRPEFPVPEGAIP
jgi:hypothetical protein